MAKAFPLEWHKQCLANRMHSIQEDKTRIDRMLADYERSMDEIAFYRKQIEEAERRGKTSFDPERFLVKR